MKNYSLDEKKQFYTLIHKTAYSMNAKADKIFNLTFDQRFYLYQSTDEQIIRCLEKQIRRNNTLLLTELIKLNFPLFIKLLKSLFYQAKRLNYVDNSFKNLLKNLLEWYIKENIRDFRKLSQEKLALRKLEIGI